MKTATIVFKENSIMLMEIEFKNWLIDETILEGFIICYGEDNLIKYLFKIDSILYIQFYN